MAGWRQSVPGAQSAQKRRRPNAALTGTGKQTIVEPIELVGNEEQHLSELA